MKTKILTGLATLFEDKPADYTIPSKVFDWQKACERVLTKLDYLAHAGLITYSQLEITKHYLPYADVEDLLMFTLGYKGFISESFDNR